MKKRKLTALLTAGVLCLSLAACAAPAAPASSAAPAAPAADATGEASSEAEDLEAELDALLTAEDTQEEQAQEAEEGAQVSHLNFGSTGYFWLESMDPANSYDGWFLDFFGIGETLFMLDKDYNVIPWLAESAEMVDPLTWEITLRDDVVFHNGEKLTAERAAASLEYMMETSDRGRDQFTYESFETDGQKLTIHTSVETAALPRDLCDPLNVIQYIGDGIDYSTQAIMTGPFVSTHFEMGVICELEKFDDYWGGAAKTDTITLITYGDNDSMVLALQNGEIDLAVEPDPSSLSLFAGDDEYTISAAVSTYGIGVEYNLSSMTLEERIAASYCIDRDGYCELMHNQYIPTYSMFPDNLAIGDNSKLDLTVDRFDPDYARQLLEENGYSDSDGDGYLDKDGEKLSIKFVFAENPQWTAFGELWQSDCKKAGIEVILESYQDYSDKRTNREFDAIPIYGLSAPTGDPGPYFSTFIVSTGSNNIGYNNPDFDALYEEYLPTSDEAKRAELALKMQQEILDDCYMTVFCNREFWCVHNSRVTGFEAQPSEYYLVNNEIGVAE